MPMSVEVDGVPQLINRISKFDKDVYKILQREVKEGLSDVAGHARANTPERALRGWGTWPLSTGRSGQVGAVTLVTGVRELGFRGSDVRGGIQPQAVRQSTRGQVTKFSGRVITKTPAGAIFSLAGSRNRSGDPFNSHLNRKHGTSWPRTLTDALYAEGPGAREEITNAIQKAAKSVTGRSV